MVARYCSACCVQHDWLAGTHKAVCKVLRASAAQVDALECTWDFLD